MWATAMGHDDASYSETNFRNHILGGVRYAAGNLPGDCGGYDSDETEGMTAPDPAQCTARTQGLAAVCWASCPAT